jgi:hypothetical protein
MNPNAGKEVNPGTPTPPIKEEEKKSDPQNPQNPKLETPGVEREKKLQEDLKNAKSESGKEEDQTQEQLTAEFSAFDESVKLLKDKYKEYHRTKQEVLKNDSTQNREDRATAYTNFVQYVDSTKKVLDQLTKK